MLWVAIILVLALVGGFLGTLLELAVWAVVLAALAFAVVGLIGWRVVSSRNSRAADSPGTAVPDR